MGEDAKIRLLDLDLTELKAFVRSLNMPEYRAGQIVGRLLIGDDIENITTLSKADRERLKEAAVSGIPEIMLVRESKLDGTVKFLFKLYDGVLVECVLMKYNYGYSVCVSSQAGCRMGCKFCASSGIAFSRDLTPGEILGQIIAVNKFKNIRIGHIVIMGIGEPLDNYDNIIKFLKLVTSPDGLNISARKISLSTCGIVPNILRLAGENIPVTLSVSLHNPFDEERSEIMPVNKRFPLDELFAACREYVKITGRRVTFEYSLIAGVNDSRRHAGELARRLSHLQCHVNLIPVNKVTGTGFERPDRSAIERFKGYLEEKGIEATVRRELGRDISAACGQLRKSVITEETQQ
ncbi:MAG: 23S rRNA (adenine(2503)-C(2))-methyltransferase RlmN [Clostridia bacterium]|nr:23S rRNA (adenine(2503)-C(2))-methyltransferase RlmN [Clostridia bacterium]